METDSRIVMENFGRRIASVWAGLRPATRGIVERALLSSSASTSATSSTAGARQSNAPYDARAEWELSRLLAALEERAPEREALSAQLSGELSRVAEACVALLQLRAQSAETFAQLLARAFRAHDYVQVDALADRLTKQLPPSEICELARNPQVTVRAIAEEALAQSPTSVLVELLADPIDSFTVRAALERQAEDYESDEARWIITALDEADAEAMEE